MKFYGAHNSWSFRSPIKWYQKVIKFTAKCQEKNIQELYNDYDITLFDLRVKFIDNVPYIHHGPVNFGTVDYDDLQFLNEHKCYVRVILESNSEMDDLNNQEFLFTQFCHSLETEYPDIKFFGGNRKYDWKIVYSFKDADPVLIDKYSSTTSLFGDESSWIKKIDDLYPKLYAKLKNKKNIKAFKTSDEDGCFFYDFVNIR